LHDSDRLIHEVLTAGASGFVLKSDAARDLVAAVESLRQNKTYFTSKVASMVLNGFLKGGPGAMINGTVSPLTSREREIVQLLSEGKSAKEVAVALNISVKTAETHRSNIMRKLGLHSISELVLYAVRKNRHHLLLLRIPLVLCLVTKSHRQNVPDIVVLRCRTHRESDHALRSTGKLAANVPSIPQNHGVRVGEPA
jgi:DNA-binding CsgD family transcriptional regulator